MSRFAPYVYGATVFCGAATLGFVLLPRIGLSLGLFTTLSDAEAYFSWATLRAVPLLVGLSIASTLLYPALSRRPIARRIAWAGLNVVVVWGIGAAVSLLRLG